MSGLFWFIVYAAIAAVVLMVLWAAIGETIETLVAIWRRWTDRPLSS